MEAEKVREYGEWYYEVTSDSPWNFALSSRQLRPEVINDHFKVEKTPTVATYP